MTVNSTAVTNATTISLNVSVSGAATVGSYGLSLINGDGGAATKSSALTVDVAPTVGMLAPAAFGQGASNETVMVSGTGFLSGPQLAASFAGGSGVSVNSVAVTNSTTLSLNLSVSAGATVGADTLALTNGDGGTKVALGVLAVDAAPTVGSLSPAALGQGATGVTVTVSGTNFVSGTLLAATFSGGTGVSVRTRWRSPTPRP